MCRARCDASGACFAMPTYVSISLEIAHSRDVHVFSSWDILSQRAVRAQVSHDRIPVLIYRHIQRAMAIIDVMKMEIVTCVLLSSSYSKSKGFASVIERFIALRGSTCWDVNVNKASPVNLLELKRSNLAWEARDKTCHLPRAHGIFGCAHSTALSFAIVLSQSTDWVWRASHVQVLVPYC